MKLPTNKLAIACSVAAIAMAVYHLASSQQIVLTTTQHYNAHLGFALVVVFLAAAANPKNKTRRVLAMVAALLSVVCWAYIHMFYMDLLDRAYFSTPPDIIIGTIMIPLVLIGAWSSFGPVIPCIAMGVMLYPFLGQNLPEPFFVIPQSVPNTIAMLSVNLDGGLFSRLTSVSANYVYLFILFGGILVSTGATRFFLDIGRAIGSKVRGGPGIAAVVSSAMVGSVSGSVAANIAITGSFTIPLMKRVGYEPYQAGAIECAASTGGLIMPPVMGTGAFVMAGLTGIPYIHILGMALLPALLYFFSAFLYVYLRGEKLQLARWTEKLDVKELLFAAPSFLGPLLVIVILLIAGKSVMFTAFWAIISVLVLPLLRKKTRPSLGKYIEGFTVGARTGSGIALMIASVGIIYSTFTYSGLGIKLAAGISAWSGGFLIPALLIIAAICVLFGMVGVGAASYIIVSMFGAPALQKMGVEMSAAHYFILFTGCFAFVTPPVAAGAIIASKLAGAPYMKTSIEATKVAVAGLLLPTMFIFVPMLLFMPQQPLQGVMGVIAVVFTLVAFQITFVGYYLRECGALDRALSATAAVLLLIFILSGNSWVVLFGLGIALFALLTFWQWRKRRAPEPISEPSASDSES